MSRTQTIYVVMSDMGHVNRAFLSFELAVRRMRRLNRTRREAYHVSAVEVTGL